MPLPFSEGQFLQVFADYNRAVWPSQLLLYAAALAGLYFAAAGGRRSGRVVWVVLSALWLWMGVVYHLAFFVAINPAASLFGALFVLQALLFAARLRGAPPPSASGPTPAASPARPSSHTPSSSTRRSAFSPATSTRPPRPSLP